MVIKLKLNLNILKNHLYIQKFIKNIELLFQVPFYINTRFQKHQTLIQYIHPFII